jgi:PTH1 family peptidyl-tRNA hydrolase
LFAIVGLGNPGAKYQDTRHNAGFWAVDLLAKSLGITNWQKRDKTEFVKVEVAGESCVLVKPLKFMNLSGEALVPLMGFFKIAPEQLIVLHDDLDLETGMLRIKSGGGAGGHRGVENIKEKLGTADFYRVRIGVGHPRNLRDIEGLSGEEKSRGLVEVSDWVLQAPRPKERELLEEAVKKAVSAVEVLIKSGLETAQREFN